MVKLLENLVDFSVVFGSMVAATGMLVRVVVSVIMPGL